MRIPQHTARGSVGFNMTPMIDVVFLLIIFFLVSSHLAKREVQAELDLPAAATGQEVEDETRRIVINVVATDEGGTINVSGRTVGPDEVAAIIRYESEQSGRQIEVRIRADRRVPYRLVEPVMLACARAGVYRVTFAVTSK